MPRRCNTFLKLVKLFFLLQCVVVSSPSSLTRGKNIKHPITRACWVICLRRKTGLEILCRFSCNMSIVQRQKLETFKTNFHFFHFTGRARKWDNNKHQLKANFGGANVIIQSIYTVAVVSVQLFTRVDYRLSHPSQTIMKFHSRWKI